MWLVEETLRTRFGAKPSGVFKLTRCNFLSGNHVNSTIYFEIIYRIVVVVYWIVIRLLVDANFRKVTCDSSNLKYTSVTNFTSSSYDVFSSKYIHLNFNAVDLYSPNLCIGQ